jgi:hypothetical protein
LGEWLFWWLLGKNIFVSLGKAHTLPAHALVPESAAKHKILDNPFRAPAGFLWRTTVLHQPGILPIYVSASRYGLVKVRSR